MHCRPVERYTQCDARSSGAGAKLLRILVPGNVRYAVERALRRSAAGMADETFRRLPPAPDLARRVEIEDELATLRWLAERTGLGRHVAELVAELEEERAGLLAAPPPQAPDRIRIDLDRLRPVAEARVRDLREALGHGGDRTRDALRALVVGDRLRIAPDPERGFRVDG